MYNNKEGESLDKFENKGERKNIGYILLFFIVAPQKKSNWLTDMGKRIRNLIYFICILKISKSYSCLFCV